MQHFKPIKQSRISEQVADQLKQSIVLGRFKAGDKLPGERELAEQFQVSRVMIREALRSLENAGFITARPGVMGGTFVTELTFEHLGNAFLDLFLSDKISIPELVQVRLLVEPEVARLAARNITPDFAAQLMEILRAEDLPLASLAEDLDRKTAVHFMLAEMCGNRIFEALVRSLMALTRQVVEAVNPDPQWMHPAGMHHPLVEAVLSGDEEKAEAVMRKHSLEFGENLMTMEREYRQKRAPLQVTS
jgi:GntR family transcriptional regulator, transcriptional repressor for pyruvate dehydrogenase complex